MSVQLTAVCRPVIEKTPLETALEVTGIGERALIRIIVECCAPHFQEIATTATAWLTGKLPLRNANAFKEMILQWSVPFARWLVSKREGDQRGQLQLCEGLFQRIVAKDASEGQLQRLMDARDKMFQHPVEKDASLKNFSQVVFTIVRHFKDRPVQEPSAFAFDLRGVLHQLFLIKQVLVFQQNESQAKMEQVWLYQLLPPEWKQRLFSDGTDLFITEEMEALNLSNITAEMMNFLLKLSAEFHNAKGEEDHFRGTEESVLSSLRQEAEGVALTVGPANRSVVLNAFLGIVKKLHLISIFGKAASATVTSRDCCEGFKKKYSLLEFQVDSFVAALYPEVRMLHEAIRKGVERKLPVLDHNRPAETLERAELESQPYAHFQTCIAARQLGYAFLYGMHQNLVANLQSTERQTYEKLLHAQPQMSLLTPEAFSQLTAVPARSALQVQAAWSEMNRLYVSRRAQLSSEEVAASFAPSIKKQRPAPPQKPKHKKGLQLSVADPKKEEEPASHGAAGAGAGRAQAGLEAFKKQAMVVKNEGERAAYGAAAAAAGAGAEAMAPLQGLEAIFANRSVDLKSFKVAPRVQARLNAPKTKGVQREDTWAHGFTTQLDHFLGTSYCYSVERPHPQTNQKETHHCFIVMVEDEEGPILETTGRPESVPYLATYTVDKNGVCYHRCLQKKSLFDLFNASANGQVLNLVEWPSLQQAAEQGKLRVEEQNNRPMHYSPVSGIVTVFDRKHNVTFKVLPRSQVEK